MTWQTALMLARTSPTITYEEWCGLYVHPDQAVRTYDQVAQALKVAEPILLRDRVIDESVELTPFGSKFKDGQHGR